MYTKFSDDELIEAYESMKDYSGEANATLLEEIEKRGGMNLFLEKIAIQKKKKEEIRAISGEIYALTKPGINIDFIKDHISSTILTPEELEALIEEKFASYSRFSADKKITHRTLIGSIAGSIVGIIVGSILVYYLLEIFMLQFYVLLIPVYIICYLSIRIITKQSRGNIIVFLAAFIASICAFLLGLYLANKF